MGESIIRIARKHKRDEKFNKHLGFRLSKMRHDQKYRLQDVQEMTGISKELLSRIENGKSHMTVLELMAFCVIYEVTPKDLFEGLWGHLEISE